MPPSQPPPPVQPATIPPPHSGPPRQPPPPQGGVHAVTQQVGKMSLQHQQQYKVRCVIVVNHPLLQCLYVCNNMRVFDGGPSVIQSLT